MCEQRTAREQYNRLNMQEKMSHKTNIVVELGLLLLLAALWGASYSFIKIGVTTIPPITLIAARTLIAGLILIVIIRLRGLRLPTDALTW